jgi:hypothetical protein
MYQKDCPTFGPNGRYNSDMIILSTDSGQIHPYTESKELALLGNLR